MLRRIHVRWLVSVYTCNGLRYINYMYVIQRVVVPFRKATLLWYIYEDNRLQNINKLEREYDVRYMSTVTCCMLLYCYSGTYITR